MRRLIFAWIGFTLASSIFGASTTKVGGSGTTKVGGSGMTKVNAVSSGTSLLFDGFSAGTSTVNIGNSAGTTYWGLLNFTDASAHTITKVVAKVSRDQGTITGKTFVIRIWTMTGDNLNTNIASSDGVAGVQGWNGTSVDFVFSTPAGLSASTNYAFTIDMGAADGSNFAVLFYSSALIPGQLAVWDNTKALQSSYSLDPQFQLWGTTP